MTSCVQGNTLERSRAGSRPKQSDSETVPLTAAQRCPPWQQACPTLQGLWSPAGSDAHQVPQRLGSFPAPAAGPPRCLPEPRQGSASPGLPCPLSALRLLPGWALSLGNQAGGLWCVCCGKVHTHRARAGANERKVLKKVRPREMLRDFDAFFIEPRFRAATPSPLQVL